MGSGVKQHLMGLADDRNSNLETSNSEDDESLTVSQARNKAERKENRYLRAQQKAFMLFKELDNNLGKIDKLYKDQQLSHELDFMAAYSGHMSLIQRELTGLKAQLSESEQRVKRDKAVVSLTSQVGWFKDEALTLKTEILKNKEKQQVTKVENYILGEEKWALEQALGKSQKQTKKLAEGLGKSEAHNQQLLKIIEDQ